MPKVKVEVLWWWNERGSIHAWKGTTGKVLATGDVLYGELYVGEEGERMLSEMLAKGFELVIEVKEIGYVGEVVRDRPRDD